jgi:NAD(P)-dependent dehydrogenase (short-subunit alcohol dehydrogenase family)
MVADDEIGEVLRAQRESLDEAANELVRRANKAGGQDNITVIAFEITDEPAVEPDEQTLEQTVEQLPAQDGSPEPKQRGGLRRFLPLLLLLLAIAAAAIVLWFLVR